MATEHKETTSYHASTLSLEHRLLAISKWRIWFFYFNVKKEVLHFAPEQAFYKLFRNQKNLDYTTTDCFLHWQM
jgi:hypothetical protein